VVSSARFVLPSAPAVPFRQWPVAAVCLYVSALTLLLLLLLWRTPLAISETIGVFENVETIPWTTLLRGNEEYVRPLFWLVVLMVWKLAPSVDIALVAFRLMHVAAVAWLIYAFVKAAAPRDAAGWIALPIAVTALVGTSSFRENLEAFPINPTIFVMGCALTAYALIERAPTRFSNMLAFILSFLAVAAKEQGVAVPVLIGAGVLAGAPGVTRRTALLILGVTFAYCAARIVLAVDMTPFSRPLGLGWREWEPHELAAVVDNRWLIHAYNVAATASHVVFGEPSRGIFVSTLAVASGHPQPWQWVYAASGIGAGAIVLVWMVRTCRHSSDVADRRLLWVFVAVWCVTSGLAFSYTRDRMAAVAVAFFALLLHRACRGAMTWMEAARSWRVAPAVAALMGLAVAWQLRTAATIFYVHDAAWENRKEWLVDLADRHQNYADRPAYVHLLDMLQSQGSDATVPGSSPPRNIVRWIDYRW
jgi:hypothetical protein